jgi:hypothetical protein
MRATLLKFAVLMMLSASVLAGQIYKWVDAQGVTHFDAQPPAGQSSTTIDTKTAPAPTTNTPTTPKTLTSPSNEEKQKAANAKVSQEVQENQQRTDEYCDQARTNLAQLTTNPRVRQDVDGDVRRLTEEERQAKIAETTTAINDNCK